MFEALENASRPIRCLWAALVLAVVLVVFWPVLTGSALCIDDRAYLAENTLFQDPSWSSAWRCLTEVATPSSVRGYYHPLAILSLMLDCALGGQQGDLAPFHRTNVLLHLASVVLVVVLLWRLGFPYWAALSGALAFGIHPLSVETVAWVGERKTLLAGTLGLASLASYVEYVRAESRARKRWFYAAVIATTTLALLSKPSSVVLPVLMIVIDVWPLKRTSRARWLDKLPLLSLSAASFVVTLVSHSARVGVGLDASVPLAAAHKLALFARNTVWPVGLTPWRNAPDPLSLSNPTIVLAIAFCATWLLACIAFRRRAPAFVAGSALFVLALAPTLVARYSIVYAFDNYAYLALFGAALSFAAGLAWVARSWSIRPWLRSLAVVALPLLLLLEVGATRRQLARWRDTETLYGYMLALTPDASMLHSDLGMELERQGRFDAATLEYRRALQLDPSFARAHNNLGQLLARLGHADEALASYREAIRLEPDLAEAHNNLGAALQSLGQLDEAVLEHQRALALRPDWADAHNNLGVAQMGLGRPAEARASFEFAVRFKPDFAVAFGNLGECDFELGHFDAALSDYARAVQLEPTNTHFRGNLAELLAQQGRTNEAIEQLREAVRLSPDDAQLRQRLVGLLNAAGGH